MWLLTCSHSHIAPDTLTVRSHSCTALTSLLHYIYTVVWGSSIHATGVLVYKTHTTDFAHTYHIIVEQLAMRLCHMDVT